MTNKISYKYDKESKLFYKYYQGLILINDILSSWSEAIKLKLIPKEVKGIIIDTTNARLDFKIMDDITITNYLRDNSAVFQNLRIAVLPPNLEGFIVPMLVKYENDGFQFQPFLKLEIAKNWVLKGYKGKALSL